MVNIDFSVYLRVRRAPVISAAAGTLLRGARREQFRQIDKTIVVHDLRRGIPATTASVDVVYHSHVLEHIDRSHVAAFFGEIHRVLRPDGIHRVVVPDLELLARTYLDSVENAKRAPSAQERHDASVGRMIEQMVRREPFGTSQQGSVARWLENTFLGDARKRGETHQWMWDQVNLSAALTGAGFHSIRRVDHTTSDIAQWDEIGLDRSDDGSAYKPGSLFMEARG